MDDLDLIKQKINLVDLIQEYLPLKKSGVNFKTQCPFHQEKTPSFVVSPERQIWHCFGCFPPGQLIKTPFGYHPIEQVVEDEFVVSGKGDYRRVLARHSRNYSGDLIKVTTRKIRRPVEMTGDHSVFVVRSSSKHEIKFKYFAKRYRRYLKYLSSNPEYFFKKISKWLPVQEISARDLQLGDLLLFPLNNQITEVNSLDLNKYLTRVYRLGPRPTKLSKVLVNRDFLKLMGYWVAEGSSHRAYIRFSLGNHEEDFALEIVDLINKVFGLKASIHRRVNGGKTGIEVTACHASLANIFENLCGKGAENKHIPFIFQELPVEKQRVILEAIHQGDGTDYIASKSTKAHKSITTISKILSEQIVDILLRLNIFPSLYVGQPKTDFKGVNHRQSYTIVWSQEANLRYGLVYHQPDGRKYWLLPIEKIETRSYKGPVYNLTVDQDHSYIASHFAVSNCGKGGDAFKFLMEKEGLDFVEALEILANKAGIVLKRKKADGGNKKNRLFEANQKAGQFFHHILINHKLGKAALDYLHTRGLTDATIKEFNLGYAPNSWDSLLKFLIKRGYNLTELTEAGLIVPSPRGGYDRFRGRIIFPLVDVQNQIRGFSGRILGMGEPKYLNSPQTLIFDKSQFLFGLNLTRSEIKQKNVVILTEGEMDMLMSYQAGVKNVVATKGTALTTGQIEQIKRYTDNLILCFDQDLAGDSASRRGIEMAERIGLSIKVIKIDGGKDPADLVKTDAKSWAEAVKTAEPIYDYYLRSIGARFNLKSADGKKEAAKELLPIWSKIADTLVKEHYIQKLSAHLEVEEEFLRGELAKVKDRPQTGNYQNLASIVLPKTNLRSRREIMEEYLVILLLKVPKSINFVPNFPETIFSSEILRSIYVMLVLYLDTISFKTEEFSIVEFCQSLPVELVPIVDRLYLSEIDDKLIEPKNWEIEVKKMVLEVKKSLVRASLEKLSLQIKSAESYGRMAELEPLNRRFRDLSLKLKNL